MGDISKRAETKNNGLPALGRFAPLCNPGSRKYKKLPNEPILGNSQAANAHELTQRSQSRRFQNEPIFGTEVPENRFVLHVKSIGNVA